MFEQCFHFKQLIRGRLTSRRRDLDQVFETQLGLGQGERIDVIHCCGPSVPELVSLAYKPILARDDNDDSSIIESIESTSDTT